MIGYQWKPVGIFLGVSSLINMCSDDDDNLVEEPKFRYLKAISEYEYISDGLLIGKTSPITSNLYDLYNVNQHLV